MYILPIAFLPKSDIIRLSNEREVNKMVVNHVTINCEYNFNVQDFVDHIIECYQEDYGKDWKKELKRYLGFSKSQADVPLKEWIQDEVHEACDCNDNLKVDWSNLHWIHEIIVNHFYEAIRTK